MSSPSSNKVRDRSPRWVVALAGMVMLGTASAPARAETITVTIEKLVFSPVDIEAKVGDTILWVNNGMLLHTATVKGDWEVKIPPKKSASLVLKKPGSIDYFCRFHPNMKGHITVSP